MSIPCIKCKGNDPSNCGRTFCPIVAKAEAMFKTKISAGISGCKDGFRDSFAASAPAPFVGRMGYPSVNVGILAPQVIEHEQGAAFYDAPRQWALDEISIHDIVGLRSALINSRFKAEINSPKLQISSSRIGNQFSERNKFLEISQEVGTASKPVDVEIRLEQKPKFRIDYNAETAPSGPRGILKHAAVTSNPKIDSRVDRVVSDIDMKTVDGITLLYDKGFDENFLSRMLSVGTLGMKKDRKLVPTRWSITATDDMIAKNFLSETRNYSYAEHSAYFGGYLGNYYIILFFPGPWSYELFEMYLPHANWNPSAEFQYSTDNEGYWGRKDYAENTQGGYYAARLPITEKLHSMKKQASVLALRFITREYAVPLGVWVVREATRKAMQSRPVEFSSRELMLNYARILVKKKFGLDIDTLLKSSVFLKEMKEQRRIGEFA